MALIELSHYVLPAADTRNPLCAFDFTLQEGDVCWLDSDSLADASQFIRAVATLLRPISGTYRYRRRVLNFNDYRSLLPLKKSIAYIGPHAALICNRTVRENLMMMRSYFDNAFAMGLPPQTAEWCDRFGLGNKLDMRPVDLHLADIRTAVVIRELSKHPALLLIENPEDYLGHFRQGLFINLIRNAILGRKPVIFTCSDMNIVETLTTRRIVIHNGALHEKRR